MKIFYHGSVDSNVKQLNPISKCHDNPFIKCAYCTDNFLYALLYIRDMDINIVTAGIKSDGLIYYEEQFEGQLKTLYENINGYIYYCKPTEIIKAKTEGIYYSPNVIPLYKKQHVNNVYELLKQGVQDKKIILTKPSPERMMSLNEHIAKKIIDNNFFSENIKLHDFYFKNFNTAWNIALSNNKK